VDAGQGARQGRRAGEPGYQELRQREAVDAGAPADEVLRARGLAAEGYWGRAWTGRAWTDEERRRRGQAGPEGQQAHSDGPGRTGEGQRPGAPGEPEQQRARQGGTGCSRWGGRAVLPRRAAVARETWAAPEEEWAQGLPEPAQGVAQGGRREEAPAGRGALYSGRRGAEREVRPPAALPQEKRRAGGAKGTQQEPRGSGEAATPQRRQEASARPGSPAWTHPFRPDGAAAR
jgi:hypothetical protein